MAELELRSSTGAVERRELSRSQPLSIGSQPFNDITIEDEDVGPLHCRIGWNKAIYEVTAAVQNGVDLNGHFVQHAVLKPGDILRIGSWDLVFQDSSEARHERDKHRERGMDRGKDKTGAGSSKKAEQRRKHKPEPEPAIDVDEELSTFEGPIIAESLAELIADPEVVSESQDEMSGLLLTRNPSEWDVPDEAKRRGKSQGALSAKALKRQVSAAIRGNRVRPGEQEVLKSPLVLGLGGGGLVLLLVSATIWFLMGRDVTRRLYEKGDQELGSGQYSQAITTFEEFLKTYPGNSLAPQARVALGRARIQKELSGATPSWKRGLEELENFLEEHRNDSDFKSLQPVICGFAEQIATGSVKTAESTRDSSLLTVSADAARRLEQFSDPQQPPTTALEQIRVGTEQAKSAIRKQQTFDAALAAIQQALTDKQPISVLRERSRLLQTYPDFASQKKLRDALQQAMEMEKSVVAVSDPDQAAATTETAWPDSEFVVPIYHTRSRSDEAASGRLVYAVAKDALYAVDAVTGETVWRKLIGPDTPFFPVLTAGAEPGVLIGETNPPALVLRQAETGKLIWRQSLPQRLRGSPLVHNGEIFVAAEGRLLNRLDLDTGRWKEQMTFSQEILGPPTLSPGGEHLLVVGETALIYALSIRPLEVAAITFTNHPAGAVSVPLLTMGQIILMCDNDQLESCRLRVWDAAKPQESLPEVNEVRISGQVVDRPVLRGPQLVVASTGERLQAFTVSDDPAKKGLAAVGQYQLNDGYRGPMQLALGPDQQFWMESSAFRRFEIFNESLRLDQNSTAPGLASQPLQFVGDQFFVGRHPLYSTALIFTQVDRERMSGSWRTILGSGLLAWTSSRSGGIVAVTETGTVVSLSPARLQQGGLELRGSLELEIPSDLAEPLGAARLSDGSLAAWCGGAQPKLWHINAQGQVESEYKLDAALDTEPVLLKGGLVLPQPGRLKWLSLSRGGPRVQDFAAPVVDGAAVRWAHLIRLDDNQLAACDRTGRLSRLQIRQEGVAFLGEAANFQLPQPVDVRPVVQEGDFWVADAAGTVRRLDSRSFDVKSERTFPGTVIGLWVDDQSRWVQLPDGQLCSLMDIDGLPDAWTVQLGKTRLLGPPVRIGDKLGWVGRDGTVFLLQAATGQEISRKALPQSLGHSLIPWNNTLLSAAADGTIYRVQITGGEGQ